MQSSVLTVCAVVFSLAGLMGLFFFINQTGDSPATIAKLLEQKPRTMVHLTGQVLEWKQFSTKTSLTLWDGNELSAFIPNDSRISWKPKKGIFKFFGKLVRQQDRELFQITDVLPID